MNQIKRIRSKVARLERQEVSERSKDYAISLLAELYSISLFDHLSCERTRVH